MLTAKGNDPLLIDCLLSDALLIDVLSESLLEQMEKAERFKQNYLDTANQLAHESPMDEVKKTLHTFEEAMRRLKGVVDDSLMRLTGLVKDMIQLVFISSTHQAFLIRCTGIQLDVNIRSAEIDLDQP